MTDGTVCCLRRGWQVSLMVADKRAACHDPAGIVQRSPVAAVQPVTAGAVSYRRGMCHPRRENQN